MIEWQDIKCPTEDNSRRDQIKTSKESTGQRDRGVEIPTPILTPL